jgi:hypothetical protein
MPMFVISLIAIVALVGATLALSMDSRASNELQYTADSAALGGAVAFIKAQSPKLEERKQIALKQAQDLANANSEYSLVDLKAVATSEDEYGQYLKMGVELEFKPTNAAASLVGRNANVAVRSRAVADATWGFPLCLLALSETGEAFTTSDNAAFASKNCIVWSNSESLKSFNFEGGSVTAKSMCTAGGVFGGMRAKPAPSSQCRTIPDPLDTWATPTPGNCPSFSTTQGANLADLADQLSDTLRFDFEEATFAEEHSKLLLVLANMHNGGWNGNGRGSLARAVAASPSIAEIESDLAPYNNLSQYLSGHPYFKLANGTLDDLGRLTTGAGEGMTLAEAAQFIGLFDNADPADYAGDDYVDVPTLTLNPGTFCGRDISEGHVKFNPGTYFIKDGPLTVRRRATLSGEGVTIVMSGQNAYFGILDEARLNLTAPSGGELAGFALVEDKARTYKSTGLSFPNLPQLQSQDRPISKLTGSGSINAIGTIYLPRHDFAVSGDGAGQQTSPFLQIVANTIAMTDNGKISIDFDENKAKVPAGIKAERTARLIE